MSFRERGRKAGCEMQVVLGGLKLTDTWDTLLFKIIQNYSLFKNCCGVSSSSPLNTQLVALLSVVVAHCFSITVTLSLTPLHTVENKRRKH